ncbi:MAG TPA: sigma-E processing peptidase SpoIIGA [Bacilli bacterium]
MKIYLDLVFLINFSINFIFLYIIQLLFNDNFSIGKACISSLLATTFLILFLFDKAIFTVIKISGGLILVFVGIGAKKIAIKTSLFYLLELSLTGIVTSFKMTGMMLIFALVIVIILIIIQSFKKESIFINHFKYNVSVTFLGKQLSLKGFLDTGNLLTINNMPVIFINQKFYNHNIPIYKITNIQTINQEKQITCYLPESFYITIGKKKIEKQVVISFAQLGNDFDCLLNYHLFF